jgi:TRAP transporter TAXI family solute receptor
MLAETAIAAAAVDRAVTILTGRGSSVYYTLGVALGEKIDKAPAGIKTSVQGTKGSADNLDRLQQGNGDIAFALGDALADAWNGNEEAGFVTPHRKLRGIAGLYPDYIQIVARGDAGISTLSDLEGKRVSVGQRKSGTEVYARAIFTAAGLSYERFAKVEYVPLGESVELMKDGRIDAMLQSVALGAIALRDLANAIDIVVVPIPPDVIRKTSNPAYLPAVIPANTYRGQSTNVPVATVQNYLVTRDDLANDVVYAITKALWSGLDELAATNPAARAIDRKRALEGMPVPLHPGAEKYYREIKLTR